VAQKFSFIMFIVVMVFLVPTKFLVLAKGLGKGNAPLQVRNRDIKQEIHKSADKQGIDTSFVNSFQERISMNMKKRYWVSWAWQRWLEAISGCRQEYHDVTAA